MNKFYSFSLLSLLAVTVPSCHAVPETPKQVLRKVAIKKPKPEEIMLAPNVIMIKRQQEDNNYSLERFMHEPQECPTTPPDKRSPKTVKDDLFEGFEDDQA